MTFAPDPFHFFSSNKWRKFPPSFFQSFNHRSSVQNDRARHSSAVYIFHLSLVSAHIQDYVGGIPLSIYCSVLTPSAQIHARSHFNKAIWRSWLWGGGRGGVGKMVLAQLWTSGQCVWPGIWWWARIDRQAEKEMGTDRLIIDNYEIL